MDKESSTTVFEQLEGAFRALDLHRPMRVERFEAGTLLTYDVRALDSPGTGRVRIEVEKFVGGGFAGQVYRVRVLEIEASTPSLGGLVEGGVFGMKILIPPGAFSKLFRNALYGLAFQGPFQLQVNPSAARSGALWQKFIRRGAGVRLGDEGMVADIHATFVDHTLGSCGELMEWVQGRTWRLEVDEHLDLLRMWRRGIAVDPGRLGSPEYRSKRVFMARFVDLLHEMGAHEFARQYEWSTCKSQPNCLKREETEGSPEEGLVAVDFRAGLALLPFLPMSPGDFKLIAQGIGRGSLVQFDRGDLGRLERFVGAHSEAFTDMLPMLEELKETDRVYRDSLPDIAHHHVKVISSPRLWSGILESARTGWRIRNLIDDDWATRLSGRKALTLLFLLIGFIPVLGRILRRIWAQPSWRRHYRDMFTDRGYLLRALRGKAMEKATDWYRSGRIDEQRALGLPERLWRFTCHYPLSLLPAGIHRFLTDWPYARERMSHILLRPFRLYFDPNMRTEWLQEMVRDGKEDHMLDDKDAKLILSQIHEPYIQKYLKSLAVHLCTLPVTQVVSVLVAVIYVMLHPEMPRAQAYAVGLGIIALFQVVPISPGSLVRGLYVVYLIIRERNFRDFNIAVFLGFFKYIGYLAFPIQMAYRYPALARFMAGHWATEAVHIVPVFGERGALLERSVFCLFYNWPLTIRRRIRDRNRLRSSLRPRYWHIVPCSIAAAGLFGLADYVYVSEFGRLPGLREIWWLTLILPMLCGAVVTLWAGGAPMWKRVVGGVLCGCSSGIVYTGVSALLAPGGAQAPGDILINLLWRAFVFSVFSTIALLITEIGLPGPPVDG